LLQKRLVLADNNIAWKESDIRRAEEHDMKNIHSQLHLAVFHALLLLVIAGLSGCGGGGSDSTSASNSAAANVLASIAIQPADNRLAVGKSQQFTAIGTYTDGSTSSNLGSSLSWNSSATSAATITPTGMATAVAAGQITITAALGNISGTTTLTIPVTTLVSLSVTPSNPAIAINTAQQYTATGAYSDGTFQALTSAVTWNSSDTSIASIAPDGKAIAVAAGSTNITATLGSTSANTTLNVTPAALHSIAVTPADPVIAAGTTQQLIATGTFSDSTTQDLTAQATWSSLADSTASITQDGKATAVAAGSTTITAALGSSSGTTTLNVNPPALLLSIAITPSDPVITAGTTQQFIATGTFSDGTTQDLTSQGSWSSSASSVVSITLDGKATAVAAGTTAITAVLGGVSGSQSLNVTHATVTGTWEGTYSIYDASDTTWIGTYTFKLVLDQSGTDSVTGSSALRFDTIGQVRGRVDGLITEANVTGRQVNFIFTYRDTTSSLEMVNTGTATITDTSMTGNALENHSGGYSCSYIFSLTKL